MNHQLALAFIVLLVVPSALAVKRLGYEERRQNHPSDPDSIHIDNRGDEPVEIRITARCNKGCDHWYTVRSHTTETWARKASIIEDMEVNCENILHCNERRSIAGGWTIVCNPTDSGAFNKDGSVTKFFERVPLLGLVVSFSHCCAGNEKAARRAALLNVRCNVEFVVTAGATCVGALAGPAGAIVAGSAAGAAIGAAGNAFEAEIADSVASDAKDRASMAGHSGSDYLVAAICGGITGAAGGVVAGKPGVGSVAWKALLKARGLDKAIQDAAVKGGLKVVIKQSAKAKGVEILIGSLPAAIVKRLSRLNEWSLVVPKTHHSIRFSLDLPGRHGHQYHLSVDHKSRVSVSATKGIYELFIMCPTPSRDSDTCALMAVSTVSYLCCQDNGTVVADRRHVDWWETFRIVMLNMEVGTCVIQGHHGRFLRVREDLSVHQSEAMSVWTMHVNL